MKFNQFAWFARDEGETIAVFGAARLVKHPDGKPELRGDWPADRALARDWCSLFLHEAGISAPTGCTSLPLANSNPKPIMKLPKFSWEIDPR